MPGSGNDLATRAPRDRPSRAPSRPEEPFREVASALTRRAAIKRGLAGALAVGVAPRLLPARLLAGPSAPSNRLTVGLVGTGLMGIDHMSALSRRDDCRVLAVCDVARDKAEDERVRLEKIYAAGQADGTYHGVAAYQYPEELLARADIDVVFVCTPDHWHAGVAHAAMLAGKDVYGEKPLTLTVREGRLLVDTARRYGRVYQTGTQQRSSFYFRQAVDLVRNGLLGEIKVIRARLGHFAPAPVLQAQPVPADFDYDRWLGPTPWRPYNKLRVLGDYGGGWRCFLEYGGRKNGDWGAHHFDIIQWALGMDKSGPVEYIPRGYEGTKYQTHIYANGIRVERKDEDMKAMIEFIGKEGTVWVSRGGIETDPPDLASRTFRPDEVQVEVSNNHRTNFFDAVRTRQRPISDVAKGHRSGTICHLNNIAKLLDRPLHWDPVREDFIDDPEASRHLDRPRRAPYALG